MLAPSLSPQPAAFPAIPSFHCSVYTLTHSLYPRPARFSMDGCTPLIMMVTPSHAPPAAPLSPGPPCSLRRRRCGRCCRATTWWLRWAAGRRAAGWAAGWGAPARCTWWGGGGGGGGGGWGGGWGGCVWVCGGGGGGERVFQGGNPLRPTSYHGDPHHPHLHPNSPIHPTHLTHPSHPSHPPIHPTHPPIHPTHPPIHPSHPPTHPSHPPASHTHAHPQVAALDGAARALGVGVFAGAARGPSSWVFVDLGGECEQGFGYTPKVGGAIWMCMYVWLGVCVCVCVC